MTTPAPRKDTHSGEEPEITQEDAVPSDGKDVEGEEMMKKVSNKKLSDLKDDASEVPAKSQGGKRD